MTGSQFLLIMKQNGYNQTTLAQRWGVVRQTVGNCCKAKTVDPLYADAILAIAYEKQAGELIPIVRLFNENEKKS